MFDPSDPSSLLFPEPSIYPFQLIWNSVVISSAAVLPFLLSFVDADPIKSK